MSIAIVTGACGLIGSETCRLLHDKGLTVVGIDNDMRRVFFGDDASTAPNATRLRHELSQFELHQADIRDDSALETIFSRYGTQISLVVHTAAQPSHDWATRDPLTDFSINATGTLLLLEKVRRHCPSAVFIFTSTNKVYGDTPNRLPLVELETRFEVEAWHPFAAQGIDETMSIDATMHSVFGASKVAADVMVQEYGRYFGLQTGIFRCGCLTGPAHAGAELHGFLAYLAKCCVEGLPYTVHGYGGKQVRDNIHAFDLTSAFWEFFQAPRAGAVYNMGGGRRANCSVLEAVALCEKMSGRTLDFHFSSQARRGDHIWWISDTRRFESDFPTWRPRYDLQRTIEEIIRAQVEGQSA